MAIAARPPASLTLCALVTCAVAPACQQPDAAERESELQIASEALRLRVDDALPRTSPFFDGHAAWEQARREQRSRKDLRAAARP